MQFLGHSCCLKLRDTARSCVVVRASSLAQAEPKSGGEDGDGGQEPYEEYKVEILKPYGLKFAKGRDGGTYIEAIFPGSSAEQTSKFSVGDKVIATRGWPHANGVCKPNTVLGVLCRQNFSGFVQMLGEGQLREIGWRWEHYKAAQAPPGEVIDEVLCHTRADMVINSFWTFYRCEERYEEAAATTIDAECKRLLQNLRNRVRVQAVRDYYATRGIKKDKTSCCDNYLRKNQYTKVPARWCVDKMDCWGTLVDEWCTDQWRAVHDNAKDRRAQMVGVPHHQGSANLFQFRWNWAKHNNTEVPEVYDLYAMAHTASYKKAKAFSESDLDHPGKFTNISSHHKLVRYNKEGKARKGRDFNPSQQPIDLELVMVSGGGRSHGSLAIGDGLIRCPVTLREIKARQTSSCPGIRPRPRPVDLAIEVAIQNEREKTQTLLEERDRLTQTLLEERDRLAAKQQLATEQKMAQLLEEERARNEACHRAMYEIFVSMGVKTGQTPPSMPVITTAGTHNSRAASHNPSLGETGPSNPGALPP